jgi:pyruvate formate lyase activating enzyme
VAVWETRSQLCRTCCEEGVYRVSEYKGIVFNIQRFSIHDGPGIRTTVFLKGCQLHCGWCSNPESWKRHPEILTRDIKCIHCGKCIEACPQKAISKVEDKRVIDWTKCDYCLKCAEVCAAKSIEVSGEEMTVARVLDTVMRDASFYKRTGGGMTVSGGEPLVQWEFARALLREGKQKGIHTALDTTGYADWEALDKVAEFTDLVLYDLKHMDPTKHKEATGVSNERILDNLTKIAAKANSHVWIRIPLIPDFNDSEAALGDICAFALTLGGNVEKVSILPYHKFAELKYTATGREYMYREVNLLSDDRVEELKKFVESRGLKVDVGK